MYRKRASKMHEAAFPGLRRKAQALVFQPDSLHACLKYGHPRGCAPYHSSNGTDAENDTHYRWLFETSRSLSARQACETRLFGGYNDNCKPSLHPQYEYLNVSGTVQGVRPARSSYHNLFITFVQHVRYCTTFSEKDTSIDPSSTLATNE